MDGGCGCRTMINALVELSYSKIGRLLIYEKEKYQIVLKFEKWISFL